jgi:uncharacterized protein (DUF2336 family)
MTGYGRIVNEKAMSLTREACERANVQIAPESACEANGALSFVAHLRSSGQLTAGLLLRGLLCGNRHLLGMRPTGTTLLHSDFCPNIRP